MGNLTPPHRPFSLFDRDISFPVVDETHPLSYVLVIALLYPAIAISLIVLLFVPGPHSARQLSRKNHVRVKFWELERGLVGLCLSVISTFFITQSVQNMVGKARPNFIASCVPIETDVDDMKYYHALGAYRPMQEDPTGLVQSGICDNVLGMNEAYRSFPNAHASLAWAGMLHLSLFLCAKLAIRMPQLPAEVPETSGTSPAAIELLPTSENAAARANNTRDPKKSIEETAASPPNYLIVIALIPIAAAVYICTKQYAEFYAFGSDIFAGALLGIGFAVFSFRWYHLPIGRGRGWAWGPRSPACAFGVGVGSGSYVE